MIEVYIALYIVVGLILLTLTTLAGKANFTKIQGFELKFIVGLIFVMFWFIMYPVMYFYRRKQIAQKTTKL